MSTIRSSISLAHATSRLRASGNQSRTTVDSGFSTAPITVGTSDQSLSLGDVITPQQAAVSVISGSPVLVGLDGSTYPFYLEAVGASLLIPFAVASLKETSVIVAEADSSGSLNQKFFQISDRNGTVGVWIDVDNSGSTAPAGATSLDRQIEVTGVVTDATSAQVATALASALNADAEFGAVAVTATVTVTDAHTGTRTDATDGDTGWGSITTSQQGAVSPVIHIKSEASTVVLFAIAPQ